MAQSTARTFKVAGPVAKVPVRKENIELKTAEAESTVQRHAFVPDKKYADRYVHRKVNGTQDFKLLDWCIANRRNLLMRGDTGAGKTMFPMAYAAAKGIPYYTVPCDVSIDPTALFGKMMPTDTVGKFRWVDGPVTELVRYGGILNISEINFMPPKIAASLYSLLDHRRAIQLLGNEGEHVTAHPDLLVVADMNPKYRGTMDLNLALANRFAIKVEWGYEASVEDKLVSSKSLLDLVRRIRKEDAIRTPIGTNMMEEFVEIASDLGVKFATENFVSCFAESERESVANMLDAASVEIAKEVSAYAKSQGRELTDGEPEELELDDSWFDPDNFNADDYEPVEVP